MPELPEVETVVRGLARALKGAMISETLVRRKDLRQPFPKNLANKLRHRRIISVTRRAKYILITLDHDEVLLLHLGMSGSLTISHEAKKPGQHDHLIITCDNGTIITFNDPRRFGLCDLIKSVDLPQHKLFKELGVEPLDKAFAVTYLARTFANKKVAIKLALMDQHIVVGIGNIYASEALFKAGILPTRSAQSLKDDELKKLIPAVRQVLRASIKAGGSSLRDYVQTNGELGYFQKSFAVYDREGKACPGCRCAIKKTGGIKRITQGGRSTFFCPQKQT